MPTKPIRRRPVPRRSPPSALSDAQADVLAQFDRLITNALGGLIRSSTLSRMRSDPVIVSSIGGGVVVHAAVRSKGPMTLERIKKEKPVVGIVANSLPLIDPFSLTELKPGAYVVRLRRVGKTTMAFDFFTDKSRPVYSARAEPTKPIPEDPRAAISVAGIDVDIILPWDPDDFSPPSNGTDGKFCLSLFSWSHCWNWNWPKIKWPW